MGALCPTAPSWAARRERACRRNCSGFERHRISRGRNLFDEFPVAGAIQTTNHGGQDAFVAKLSPSGAALVYSTYLGGSGATTPEEANGIAVDGSGNAYVAGVANSADFPVTAGAFQVKFKGVSDAFATKINAAGTRWVYSTYLGGGDLDWAGDRNRWRRQCLHCGLQLLRRFSAEQPHAGGVRRIVRRVRREVESNGQRLEILHLVWRKRVRYRRMHRRWMPAATCTWAARPIP